MKVLIAIDSSPAAERVLDEAEVLFAVTNITSRRDADHPAHTYFRKNSVRICGAVCLAVHPMKRLRSRGRRHKP
jgi:hypothetical protein